MTVTVIILGILVLILGWIAIAQYMRCSKLELIANNVVANMQTISEIISESSKALNNEQLVEAFSSDDEVGKFFREIRNVQEILDKFILRNGEESSIE